jgi:DNA repair protein RecO
VRNYNINGIVLKSINYKDSDKIYSILTREMGKMSVSARGVRKISSKRAGNLDTLNLVSVRIAEDSKGYKHLEEVKTLNSFKDLKKSYELSCLAYYMAELISRNIEEGENSEQVVNLFINCLKVLTDSRADSALVVNHFELGLLKELGYEFQTGGGNYKEGTLNTLSALKRGIPPKGIDPLILKEVDTVIKTFLYKHLDRKIKSLELKLG